MPRNDDIRFISSSIKIPLPSKPLNTPFKTARSHFLNATNSFSQLINSFKTHSTELTRTVFRKSHSLCSATLSLTDEKRAPSLSPAEETQLKTRQNEERVLISEVLVRNKDGEELERKDLEEEAVQALKACRPNSALTVREVQDDVHRIINSGYFCSCVPVAVDTRDGIQLVFQVFLVRNLKFR